MEIMRVDRAWTAYVYLCGTDNLDLWAVLDEFFRVAFRENFYENAEA